MPTASIVPASATELIEDKLSFLNSYPEISAARAKGIDTCSTSKLWSVDNLAGINNRARVLVGMDDVPGDELNFTDVISFTLSTFINGAGPSAPVTFATTLVSSLVEDLPVRPPTATSFGEAKIVAERLISLGLSEENYSVEETGASSFRVVLSNGKTPFAFTDPNFATSDDATAAIAEYIALCTNEFLNNPESNRRNLACPLENYFAPALIVIDPVPDPPTFQFSLVFHDTSLNFTTTPITTALVTGVGDPKQKTTILGGSSAAGSHTFIVPGFLSEIVNNGAKIVIENATEAA